VPPRFSTADRRCARANAALPVASLRPGRPAMLGDRRRDPPHRLHRHRARRRAHTPNPGLSAADVGRTVPIRGTSRRGGLLHGDARSASRRLCWAANPASMPTPTDPLSPPPANTRRSTPRRPAGKARAQSARQAGFKKRCQDIAVRRPVRQKCPNAGEPRGRVCRDEALGLLRGHMDGRGPEVQRNHACRSHVLRTWSLYT